MLALLAGCQRRRCRNRVRGDDERLIEVMAPGEIGATPATCSMRAGGNISVPYHANRRRLVQESVANPIVVEYPATSVCLQWRNHHFAARWRGCAPGEVALGLRRSVDELRWKRRPALVVVSAPAEGSSPGCRSGQRTRRAGRGGDGYDVGCGCDRAGRRRARS
ncbi:MAG: hypothetical protein R3C40_09720 [Parvularculaceae bacterium]